MNAVCMEKSNLYVIKKKLIWFNIFLYIKILCHDVWLHLKILIMCIVWPILKDKIVYISKSDC